jgi:hypothetical protein
VRELLGSREDKLERRAPPHGKQAGAEATALIDVQGPSRSGQCSRQASGAIATSLATLNGGGRSPRRLASRTSASLVGAAAARIIDGRNRELN